MNAPTTPVLAVRDLDVVYALGGGQAMRAVDRVGFEIAHGETLALVGESGCGKSSVAKAVMQLAPLAGGAIELEGQPLARLDARALQRLRRRFQMIFQDPISSLNPQRTVREILEFPLRVNGLFDPVASARRIRETLEIVGLDSESVLGRHPHEFSGGQCQRISIARALILEPVLLVCDEPVSALDVSVQAQVINLLTDLQAEFGIAYLFVAHDLAVVRHISHRVAVMYLGKIVEIAGRDTLFSTPLHPYTEILLSAVPVPDPRVRTQRRLLKGDPPNPAAPPSGCRFHTRCPMAQARCAEEEPVLEQKTAGQWVACHFR